MSTAEVEMEWWKLNYTEMVDLPLQIAAPRAAKDYVNSD